MCSPLPVHLLHVVHPHAKDEEVLLARLFGHFHSGTIHGSDSQSTVEHELHVPSSGSFRPCCGDLLGQVSCWDHWAVKTDTPE